MRRKLLLPGVTILSILVATIVMMMLFPANQSQRTVILQPLQSKTVTTLHLNNGDRVDEGYTTSGPSNYTIFVEDYGPVGWTYIGGEATVRSSGIVGVDGIYHYTFTNPSNISSLTVTYSIHRHLDPLVVGLTIALVDMIIVSVAVVVWARRISKMTR